jgi:ParB family chromosome partitioning protein
VRGVEREFDVFRGRARDLGVDLAVDGADDVEVLALDRRNPFAADEVVLVSLVGDLGARGARSCVEHVLSL